MCGSSRSRLYLAFSHISSLSLSQRTLQTIIDETASGDNKEVGTIAKAALDSANKAQSGVDSMMKNIVGRKKPERSECVPHSPFSASTVLLTPPCSTSQTTVAQGIAAIKQSVGRLEAAAVKPSEKLAKDMKTVKEAVEVLTKGGEGAFGASAPNPGPTPPPAGNGTAPPTPSASSTKDAKAPVGTGVPDKKEPAKDDKSGKQAPAKDDKANKEVPAKDNKADKGAPAKDEKGGNKVPAKDDKAGKEAPTKDEKDGNKVPAKDDKSNKQVPAKDDKGDEKAPAKDPKAGKQAPAKDDKKPPAKDDKADKKAPAVGKNGAPLTVPELSLIKLGN